ncbi:hypothetical protein ACFOG5_11385 [Pedobacter fastidiosus]|uniref:hypothetical protein n=1 Tax=Pedobacter fastidiosus TaxID=2765361 RepID=UPI003608EA26
MLQLAQGQLRNDGRSCNMLTAIVKGGLIAELRLIVNLLPNKNSFNLIKPDWREKPKLFCLACTKSRATIT